MTEEKNSAEGRKKCVAPFALKRPKMSFFADFFWEEFFQNFQAFPAGGNFSSSTKKNYTRTVCNGIAQLLLVFAHCGLPIVMAVELGSPHWPHDVR